MSLMEIEINNTVYKFRFGMGFLRDIEKEQKEIVKMGVSQEVGLVYTVADMMDGSVIAIYKLLNIANKTETPRISQKTLDAYLEDEGTDLEALKDEIMSFLSQSNVCKSKIAQMMTTLQANEKTNE